MSRRKYPAWLLLVALTAAVAGLFAARHARFPALRLPRFWSRRPSQQPFYAAPGTQFTGTRVVGRDGGERRWEFLAARISRSRDGLLIEARDIHAGRIYQKAEIICTFTAGRIRYETVTRRLTVEGGITGRWSDGTTFSAERALADLEHRTLIVPGSVTVEGKDREVKADGLTADLGAETVTLAGNVVGRWEGVALRCAEITYSLKDGSFSVQAEEGGKVELSL